MNRCKVHEYSDGLTWPSELCRRVHYMHYMKWNVCVLKEKSKLKTTHKFMNFLTHLIFHSALLTEVRVDFFCILLQDTQMKIAGLFYCSINVLRCWTDLTVIWQLIVSMKWHQWQLWTAAVYVNYPQHCYYCHVQWLYLKTYQTQIKHMPQTWHINTILK